MQPPPQQPLRRPDDDLKKEVERLKTALATETRVLAFLVVAGLVTEKKLAQIRAAVARL